LTCQRQIDLLAEDEKILTRSSLFSVLLLVAIGFAGTETYWLWKNGPWDLPNSKAKAAPLVGAGTREDKKLPFAGTEIIISKNLFDPERGEGRNREVETNSRAFQRIRSMVLLGTAILGNNRYAVLRDQPPSAVPGQAGPGQAQSLMRLKLGDDVEGFRLTDIGDKNVVFTKGGSRVEVLLDYFRKGDPVTPRAPTPAQARRVERGVQPTPVPVPAPGQAAPPSPARPPGQVAPVSPVAPRVIPNLPRRERIPVPQQNQSELEE
jgi:hypothetical protein